MAKEAKEETKERESYVYISTHPVVKVMKSAGVTYGPRNQKIPIPGIKFDFTNRVFTVTNALIKSNKWDRDHGIKSAKQLHEECCVPHTDFGRDFWLADDPDKEVKTQQVLKREAARKVEVTTGVESVTVKG